MRAYANSLAHFSTIPSQLRGAVRPTIKMMAIRAIVPLRTWRRFGVRRAGTTISICLAAATVFQTIVPCATSAAVADCVVKHGRYHCVISGSASAPCSRPGDLSRVPNDPPRHLPACPFCAGNVVVGKQTCTRLGHRCQLRTPAGDGDVVCSCITTESSIGRRLTPAMRVVRSDLLSLGRLLL